LADCEGSVAGAGFGDPGATPRGGGLSSLTVRGPDA
jgi:hypothetical protein